MIWPISMVRHSKPYWILYRSMLSRVLSACLVATYSAPASIGPNHIAYTIGPIVQAKPVDVKLVIMFVYHVIYKLITLKYLAVSTVIQAAHTVCNKDCKEPSVYVITRLGYVEGGALYYIV